MCAGDKERGRRNTEQYPVGNNRRHEVSGLNRSGSKCSENYLAENPIFRSATNRLAQSYASRPSKAPVQGFF